MVGWIGKIDGWMVREITWMVAWIENKDGWMDNIYIYGWLVGGWVYRDKKWMVGYIYIFIFNLDKQKWLVSRPQ